MRRLTLAGISAALILVVVAGCGGGSGTPSPSADAAGSPAAEVTEAPLESQAAETPGEASAIPADGQTMYAACGNVAVRKGPASDKKLVVRLKAGTKVTVVDTVSGTSYNAGSCGESGDTWVKISRIAGKPVKAKYGVDFAYAAAGFFSDSKP